MDWADISVLNKNVTGFEAFLSQDKHPEASVCLIRSLVSYAAIWLGDMFFAENEKPSWPHFVSEETYPVGLEIGLGFYWRRLRGIRRGPSLPSE